MAWAKSFNVPILITRTMNNFGERQHPEKFVPKAIRASLKGETLDIHMHKKGSNISFASRYWLHARNHADGILFLLDQGQSGMFHIAGVEKDVLEMAEYIGGEKGTGRGLKTQHVDVNSSRPGHDLRYALDDSKLRKMGWNPPVDFEESLSKTIKWTLENKVWLS
jgi:dTDP-D-glucose 4,6-dehydratase